MHNGYNINDLDMTIPTIQEFMLWNNFPLPLIFKNIDHFGLDAKPWTGQGSYFKFCSFKRQPVFCSYSLHSLLDSIKLYDYAIITDQDDKLLYVFENGELKSYC